MRALFRTGRQSDALEWFHRTRRLLNEELGVDPGERLRGAYEEILRAEAAGGGRTGAAKPAGGARTGGPSGGTPRDVRAPDGSGAVVPQRAVDHGPPARRRRPYRGCRHGPRGDRVHRRRRHEARNTGRRPWRAGSGRTGCTPRLLPRPPARFLGREDQLAALTTVLTDLRPARARSRWSPGPAGVGKTACAVQWAHPYAAAFPDGQLFADLRGFGEGDEAAPAEILRDFLLALGTPPEQIPASAQAASALFRSLVAERRLLVVLDNARSSAQVRPLLPGGPHCATLVTSRSRLDGLVATDCARPSAPGARPRGGRGPARRACSAPTGSPRTRPPRRSWSTCATGCRWRCAPPPPS